MRDKIALIAWLIMALTLEGYCQKKVEATSIYQAAYTRILQSPEFKQFAENNKCVAVFDSAVYLDRMMFYTQFDPHKKYTSTNKESVLIDSLTRLDLADTQKPYFFFPVAALMRRAASKQHCTVIIFSKRVDNWLMAEVTRNDNGGKSIRQIMPVFGRSLRYLVFFNENNQIERVVVKDIAYN